MVSKWVSWLSSGTRADKEKASPAGIVRNALNDAYIIYNDALRGLEDDPDINAMLSMDRDNGFISVELSERALESIEPSELQNHLTLLKGSSQLWANHCIDNARNAEAMGKTSTKEKWDVAKAKFEAAYEIAHDPQRHAKQQKSAGKS